MALGYDGSIRIDTRVNTKNFNNGLSKISSSLKSLAGVVGVAFGVSQLIKFGKEAVNIASDLQEVQNVVETAFGEMSYKVEEFSKTSIERFGMSELSAKRTASTYMAMSKGLGMYGDQAADMAIEAAARTGDIASFYNMTQAEADTLLKSIWTGETESLKRIGVVMTQTNLDAYALAQGIKKTTSQMSQAELVQLRYKYVMEQTNLAAGDFTKTQDSWANQTRILTEQWKSFLGIMGQGLIQVLAPALKFLNKVMSTLVTFAKSFSNVTGEVFGYQDTSGQQAITDSINDTASAEDNLTKSAKEAQKALLGFDEINILDSNKDKDTSSNVTPLPPMNFDTQVVDVPMEVNPKLTNVSNSVKKLISEFETALQPTKDALSRLWEALEPVKTFTYDSLKSFYDNFLKPLGSWTLGEGVPRFIDAISNGIEKIQWDKINTALSNFWSTLEPFAESIGDGLLWFWENVLTPLGTWVMNEAVPTFLDLLSGAISVLNPLLSSSQTVFKWLWDNFLQPIAVWTGGIIISVLSSLADCLSKIGKWMSDNQSLVITITVAINAFFGAWKVIELMSFIQQSGGVVGALNKIKTAVEAGTIAKLKDMVETAKLNLMYAKDFVSSVVKGTAALIKQAAQWVVTTAAKVADTVATAAATAATWLFNAALTVLTSPITLVVLAIGALIAIVILCIKHWDDIKEAASRCWDWIKSVWEKASTWFDDTVIKPITNFFSGLWDGIKNGFTTAFDWIKTGLKNYINFYIKIIESFINFFVDAINVLIRGINKINFKVPDWVPGIGNKSVGFNISQIPKVQIPRLATGAVIPPNAEFLATLGDQRHGRNLEAPEGLIRQIVREESGGGGDWTIILQRADGSTESTTTIKAIERKNRRSGKTIIPMGV